MFWCSRRCAKFEALRARASRHSAGSPRRRDLPEEVALRPQDRIAVVELLRRLKTRAASTAGAKRIASASVRPMSLAPSWRRKQHGSGGGIYDASAGRERGSKVEMNGVLSALRTFEGIAISAAR